MGWRSAIITNPARLSCRDRQLVVNVDDKDHTIAIEDLLFVVIDNRQVSVTAPLLANLADVGTGLIVCDEKHLPCGVFLPLQQHTRCSEIAKIQAGMSLPFKKSCWKRIIQQKIKNQAYCLCLNNRNGVEELSHLVARVATGDKSNIEALAARKYWQFLFAEPFKRRADSVVNLALNYGYSIIRSTLAKAIVSKGLLPSFGLYHDNKLNPFNLADDLVEPFRPFVDNLVVAIYLDKEVQFEREQKAQLIDIINKQVLIGKEVMSISKAADTLASCFVDAMRNNNSKELLVPEFSCEC